MTLDAFRLPAVHPHTRSRHPLRRRRHQESHQVGDFFRSPETGDARFLRKLLHRFFNRQVMRRRPFFEERLSTSGHHRAGHDAIHLHAVLDALLCECLGKCNDRCVDRCNRGKAGLWIESGASRDQNDRSL